MSEEWCLPSQEDPAFVCNMEDVLAVYVQPYDSKRPQVCMDETSKQLLSDLREPLPVQPGQPQRIDYEYKREGVANVFMFFEPLAGKRFVKITDRRTREDWAHAMKELADDTYSETEKIVIVMDNLNTHSPISFYKTFPPEEAKRLTERFEFHYTPKHGSWLNMAEIELCSLSRQCLKRRIPDKETLEREVNAWQKDRNVKVTKADWRFTTADARIKLKHLYPVFEV